MEKSQFTEKPWKVFPSWGFIYHMEILSPVYEETLEAFPYLDFI